MSIKNRKVNKLRASQESSDLKENPKASRETQQPTSTTGQAASGDSLRSDLRSGLRSDLRSDLPRVSSRKEQDLSGTSRFSEKSAVGGKVARLAAKNSLRNDQSGDENSNVPNSKRNRFISIALVCINIAIFIVLFGVLLMVLKFVFAKIRVFFSEHVAAN